ncbi:Beta-lactamase [Achromobacter deleyi]|uniref:Beta-lactamase n=2 Tax=Achromobacter deleyi TaxID=1353891 RepID=A0A6S7ANP7_9BURK|nr:Beta-lactamase [Achromobacter deleyi]CAB3918869.1 Beta-lactamase [Achromobacter deleyi]CAB3925655.1 Beta-lactamase [Achromobacter deleyi]
MRLREKFRISMWFLALAAGAGPAMAAGQPAPATAASGAPVAAVPPQAADEAINATVAEVMRQYDIPGMAIAVTRNGQQRFFNYGDASRAPRKPVSPDTLFELGSISKTFTVTLAGYAEASGKLSLGDSPARYVPELQGSAFAKTTLINLATHTAGGFPLQVPDAVQDTAQLMAYLKAWTPQYAPGTHRTYANPSIGMLGVVAARSLGQPYVAALEQGLFPKLGLRSTYVNVPPEKMPDYAWGYNKQNAAVRVNPGVLADEAYGVKSTARDMIRFVEANLGVAPVDAAIQRAIAATHTGYYQLGAMTQDLIWEQYRYPVSVDDLVAGNSAKVAFETLPVQALQPPSAPQPATWINKTGATNGFGAYVAFVPSRKEGIVILANRNYPNEARVRLALRVLETLDR